MNNKNIKAFKDHIDTVFNQLIKDSEKYSEHSWPVRRCFYSAHAIKEAGEAAVKAYGELPSGVDADTAQKACRDAISTLSESAERYLSDLPIDADEDIENTNSIIIGYNTALIYLHNHR